MAYVKIAINWAVFASCYCLSYAIAWVALYAHALLRVDVQENRFLTRYKRCREEETK